MPGGVTPAVFFCCFPVDHILKWRVLWQPGKKSERRRSFLQVLGKADINLAGPCVNVWIYGVNIYIYRLLLISLKTSHSQVDSILQSCFGWANLHPDYLQEMTSLKRRLQ